MKSIRRRISTWMLPGLAVVWMVGGVVVYRTYHSAIIASIDSENMAYTRLIRVNQRSQGRGGGPGRGRAAPGDRHELIPQILPVFPVSFRPNPRPGGWR